MRLAVVVFAFILLWVLIALLGYAIHERIAVHRWVRAQRKDGIEAKALPKDREQTEWDAQFRRTWWGQR